MKRQRIDVPPAAFTDAGAAVAHIRTLYDRQRDMLRQRFAAFADGDRSSPGVDARYPYIACTIGPGDLRFDTRRSYGALAEAGTYRTTITRPDIFEDYLFEQVALLIDNHNRPVTIGLSDDPIPLPYVIETASAAISADDMRDLQRLFTLPDLARIDDAIANGDHHSPAGSAKPLSLFSAERVDYSLLRLAHYTATRAEHFQRFVLFTNYQRYVEEFIAYARQAIDAGGEYDAFVEPGNVITTKSNGTTKSRGTRPEHLPQMPAYHLTRAGRAGITLINIGVGPSNAKTITDHLAVLRPHCWLMIGHCGGLRRTQLLGDYVLAHAYVRDDHVLDADLPPWVPIPAIAEVQVALTASVQKITGLKGRDMKTRLRTGTVFTTDDRDWELRRDAYVKRFNQSRAIAVDMESATIAANGYRFRVPYGTFLCVSDKPLHGEIKLPGMANKFYRERVGQHLRIGIETINSLRDSVVEQLHSRKLRSFDEPAFQ